MDTHKHTGIIGRIQAIQHLFSRIFQKIDTTVLTSTIRAFGKTSKSLIKVDEFCVLYRWIR